MRRVGAWNSTYDPDFSITHTPGAGGVATLELNRAYKHNITMPAGNVTIAVSGEAVGMIFSVRILQDGIGNRTVTWFSGIKWAEGGTPPTLTTAGDKADEFVFNVLGVDAYDGFIVGQNI